MDWWLQARLMTTDGKGVGRWRNYYRCEDMMDVDFRVRDLVASAQIRVVTRRRRGRPQQVIVPPQRVSDYIASKQEEAA
jgi:hypothetical protein